MAETAGTTNKKALRKLSGRFGLGMKLSPSAEHAQDSYALVGDFLSRDPYGLMYRRDDPQLAAILRTMEARPE